METKKSKYIGKIICVIMMLVYIISQLIESYDGKYLNKLLDSMMSNDIYTEYRVCVYNDDTYNKIYDSYEKEDVIKIISDIKKLQPEKINNNYDTSKLSRVRSFYSVSIVCKYYDVQDMGNYIRKEQRIDWINLEFSYENAVDVNYKLDTKYNSNYDNLYKLNGNYKFE